MRNRRDRVFIIKSINFSEADKIITVFGRERGKFNILAKGVRKLTSKNRGNIQTFSISDISYYQAEGLPLLLETEQVAVVDYKAIQPKNAQRILVILNKLLPEDYPNTKVFDSLEVIVKGNASVELINKFRTIFLIQEGLISDLSVCSSCLSADEIYLDKYTLEPLCKNCILNGNLNKEKYLKTCGDLYKETEYTNAIDRYISKVIEETA